MLLFLGLMGQVGVLGEVWEKGPLAAMAAPCGPQGDCSTPTLTSEGPECIDPDGDGVKNAYWVKHFSDGTTELAAGPNEVCGEAPAPAPAPQPAACDLKPETYPECSPTCNGQKLASTTLAMVTRNVDTNSCTATYSCSDIQENSTQCGYNPAPACTPTERKYPQCGGTTGLESLNPANTYEVTERSNCDGTKSYSNRDMGNLGQCAQPAAPAPAAPAPAAVAAPATAMCYVCDNNVWRTSSVMTQAQCAAVSNSGWNQPQAPASCAPAAPQQTQSNNTAPAQQQQTTQTQVQCSDGTIVALASQCQQQQQSQQSQNQQTQTVTNSANATGGNVNVSGGVGNNNAPATPRTVRVVQAAAPAQTVAQPKVLSEVKALPATGLPLLAWGLAGLAPVGARLRRFGASKETQVGPHNVWSEREFLKN